LDFCNNSGVPNRFKGIAGSMASCILGLLGIALIEQTALTQALDWEQFFKKTADFSLTY
jgi:hypothetical protein